MDKLPAMPPDPETEIQDLTRDECRVIVDYEDYAALRTAASARWVWMVRLPSQ